MNFAILILIILYSAVLKRAQLLLNMKHSIVRLDNVWGVGGGQRPVMFLISKVPITIVLTTIACLLMNALPTTTIACLLSVLLNYYNNSM